MVSFNKHGPAANPADGIDSALGYPSLVIFLILLKSRPYQLAYKTRLILQIESIYMH